MKRFAEAVLRVRQIVAGVGGCTIVGQWMGVCFFAGEPAKGTDLESRVNRWVPYSPH